MRAFIFDLDDTLYDQLEPFRLAWKKNFSCSESIIEPLYWQFRKFSDEVFSLTENGDMNLHDMHVYRVQKASEMFAMQLSRSEAEQFQKDYQASQYKIKLVPDMQQVLRYCFERGATLGIITNGPSKHQREKINQLMVQQWIANEQLFISSEVGFAKPDIRLFQRVVEKLALNREETYYIGDSFQNDIKGAKAAGWKTIWINRRGINQPDETVKADYVVNEQNQLETFVRTLV